MSDLKFLTYCEIDGVEHDPVEVYVDASPAEPDVNWGGSFDVTSVMVKGPNHRDLMPEMTDEEIESLTERLYQDSCDAAEDSRY
jgi:hypothetical protein